MRERASNPQFKNERLEREKTQYIGLFLDLIVIEVIDGKVPAYFVNISVNTSGAVLQQQRSSITALVFYAGIS